jgi:hypothetical protein
MTTVRWRAWLGLVGTVFVVGLHPAHADDRRSDSRAAHSIADKFASDTAPPQPADDVDRRTLERKLQDEERFRADEREMLERAKAEASERKAEEDAAARERAASQEADAKRAAAEEAQRIAEQRRQSEEAEDKAARERAAREAALIKEADARRKAEQEQAAAKAEAERKAKAEAEQLAAAKAKAEQERAEAQQREIDARRKVEQEQAAAKAEAERKAKAEAERLAAAKAKAEQERAEAQKREIEAAKLRIKEAKRADAQRREAEQTAARQREAEAINARVEAARKADDQRRMEAEREAEARQLSEKLARAREQREAKGSREGYSALGGPAPDEIEPQPASRSMPATGNPVRNVAAADTNETRATILLVMEPGTRGIRRREKTADPIVCIGAQCYVSNGMEDTASAMTRARAFGPGNTLGQRAGACRHSLVCAFRNVETGAGLFQLQPVDMRILRHDRRETQMLKIDATCTVDRGRLSCARAVRAGSYRAWIVPESLARKAGPAALGAALSAGLPDAGATAGLQR